jgi:hypothetical protein
MDIGRQCKRTLHTQPINFKIRGQIFFLYILILK